MKRILYPLVYLLLLPQTSVAEIYDEVSISFKNDALFGEDQGYTSGLELSYKTNNSGLTYYFGQDIYTPENKKTTIPVNGEHPYGAWLYIGASKKVNFNQNINSIKVSVGTIGNDAKGKLVSNQLHKIIDATEEKGWDSQVKKSVAYNLNIKSFYTPLYLYNNNYSIKPYFIANIGNIFTDIGLGISIQTQLNKTLKLNASGDRKYIDRNIFLDGNSQYKVKKLNYKNTFTLGLESTYVSNYTISAEIIFNSKEYTTQSTNNIYSMIKIARKF